MKTSVHKTRKEKHKNNSAFYTSHTLYLPMRSSLSAFRSLSRATTSARAFRPSMMTSTRPMSMPLTIIHPRRSFSNASDVASKVVEKAEAEAHTQQMRILESFAKLGTASVAGATFVLLGNNLGATLVGCVTFVFVAELIKEAIETNIMYNSLPYEKRQELMEAELQRRGKKHEKSS